MPLFQEAQALNVHGYKFTDIGGNFNKHKYCIFNTNTSNPNGHDDYSNTPCFTKDSSPDVEGPPRSPRVFGRSRLIENIVQVLLQFNHVALIGTGGIGKTTIAKAVLTADPLVTKFDDRRCFVRLDTANTRHTTLDIFLNCILKALGVRPSTTDKEDAIARNLSSSPTLLVLDGADRVLGSSADAGRISTVIERFSTLSDVAIMMTTRLGRLPVNVAWTRVHVPPLDETAAIDVFTRIYNLKMDECTLRRLLSSLDYHPLSIILLAQIATENRWTPVRLVEEWESQKAHLLGDEYWEHHSLATVVRFPLESTSVGNMGNTPLQILQAIAFFPRGLCEEHLTDLFPTYEERALRRAADILCKHSLTYRKGAFITMLNPIRLHISAEDNKYNFPLSHEQLFQHLRAVYYERIEDSEANKTWLLVEDYNLEHLIALDLDKCTTTNMQKICRIFVSYISFLLDYKPRTTYLRSLLMKLPEGNSVRFRLTAVSKLRGLLGNFSKATLKGMCIAYLGMLSCANGRLFEGRALLIQARNVFPLINDAYDTTGTRTLKWGDLYLGKCYIGLGNFKVAEKVIEATLEIPVPGSNIRDTLDEQLNMWLGWTKAFRGTSGVLPHLLKALAGFEEIKNTAGCRAVQICLGQVKLFAGNHGSGRRHFEIARTLHDSEKSLMLHQLEIKTFIGFSDVAMRLGNIAEVHAWLSYAWEVTSQVRPEESAGFGITHLFAAYHAARGDFTRARGAVKQAIETAHNVVGLNTGSLIECLYIAGCIELLADDIQNAINFFSQMIQESDNLLEMMFKARAKRALGEIALLQQDIPGAHARFTEAQSLCSSMGIQATSLYFCYSYFLLDRRLNGWALFQEGCLPSA